MTTDNLSVKAGPGLSVFDMILNAATTAQTSSDESEYNRLLKKLSGRDYDLIAAALAAGRTRCVQVLSEAECRDRFEEWLAQMNEIGGFKRIEEVWLACAKAMGAVADTGGQG